jgi:DNA-binding NarL/FixJ family response regulator
VLVVDDQRVVRDGLTALLDVLDGLEVVGAASDGAQALELAEQQQPDVVLMDLRMPVMDGVEATRQLRARMPDVAVVVLTTHADDESVFAALRAGARGYLTKDAGAAEIARAISVVAAGQALLDPGVQARLLETLERAPLAMPQRRPVGLTERETEVLALIAAGLSNSEIAQRLVVSEATVKTHINRIFARTGVRDRAQAVAYAYRTGVASP